ncbi:polysaccharide pyruvyl transferase family protein [Metabacillus indicus]|uniref:polysaccharide pyruvyl transferase family protein n=1 Tax=Metabacillus indicus TaxID=246786 RepID=UPI003178265D
MKKLIILRSSWQVINIGDIAHTPGILAIFEKYMPDVEVVLWASADFTSEVSDMVRRRFPGLKIVKGYIKENGAASNDDLQDALNQSVFLLHGSGPLLVAHEDVEAYSKHYEKPFGVFGITYGGYKEREWCKEIHDLASFIYFRDSISLKKAINDEIKAPLMKFGPDSAFAADLENDQKATVFLADYKLESGKFLCCISRYRYTPYWEVENKAIDTEKYFYNEQMKEHDHLPLREAIIQTVRNTNMKILLCPEDITQMKLQKEIIFDKLPKDVQSRVVLRETFWLTDEALSVYRKSAGLFGNEMHSPIMCIGNGIPAIVCRWEEQTTKGYMWNDIGLGEWLFNMDVKEERQKIVPAVLEMALNNEEAKSKAINAAKFVEDHYKEMVRTIYQVIG